MPDRRGILIALAIALCWCGLLVSTLANPPDSPAAISAVIVAQAFLFTGLFITAHDAMHGLVAPTQPRLNRLIGASALWLHSGLRYGRMLTAHHEHHRTPGRTTDPDYHEGEGGALGWALRFMWQYTSLQQILWMAAVFNGLHHFVGLPQISLLLFWILPMVLSTAQLFYVGTYLPHRSGSERDPVHRAATVDLPPWLSFIACYHFGYHYEHHASPSTPWWGLAAKRNERRAGGYSAAS